MDMESSDEQQFCLRWNNFQANITSQFETLRDDEDFTDVTIACEGQRIQAHKVVLSACSPYFKELFKNNPCSHPIIFMRDVEARHVVALMEFMYAGEVNVAQAHLSGFLKTAESLQIRGLTDSASPDCNQRDDDNLLHNLQPSSSKLNQPAQIKQKLQSCNSTVTSSQDIGLLSEQASSPPPNKKQCKISSDFKSNNEKRLSKNDDVVSPISESVDLEIELSKSMQPKEEIPDYLSDDDKEDAGSYFQLNTEATFAGGMEIIPQIPHIKETGIESTIGPIRLKRRQNTDTWSEYQSGTKSPDLCTRLKEANGHDGDKRNRLVKLGEGIEIYEEQLRTVKWSDYRKLTRGLATILFSPAELATCSVTGQRWSRAGSGERPVKPALDRAKVQAIISYVATRFPMVEISRIKQVLAYKCKENSTAFKMKAVRYLGDQIREPDKLN